MEIWSSLREGIAAEKRVGFDLEGDFNLHRYGRRICLFQLATPTGVFLLDPLEVSWPLGPDSADWQSWKALLEDPTITKVIWAAQNDVRALKFCYGIQLRGLFDLFDAARLTGVPKPSLPLLASRYLGLELVKHEQWQVSDWNQRPLAPEQLEYAALDVKYLLPLAEVLEQLLVEKRQRNAFDQRMRSVEAYEYPVHAQPWLKVKGAGALLPKEQARLKDLWQIRDEKAKATGLAPWKIQANEDLLTDARTLPYSTSSASGFSDDKNS